MKEEEQPPASRRRCRRMHDDARVALYARIDPQYAVLYVYAAPRTLYAKYVAGESRFRRSPFQGGGAPSFTVFADIRFGSQPLLFDHATLLSVFLDARPPCGKRLSLAVRSFGRVGAPVPCTPFPPGTGV